MKKLIIIHIAIACLISKAYSQIPDPALIGYWHNWNDANAPYIQLDDVDNRYNVIEIAFAVPTSPSDMNMIFSPDGVSQSELITKIQELQSQEKKVLLSIGGATTSIDLTTEENKDAFVSSLTAIINTYGFDGIDIDIENGNSILISGGTIEAPGNIAQVNLIDAIKQIMENYQITNSKKLLLTMAPETAYVQGGQSAFGSIWGGYLPIINQLRDSIDVLQVQLYNSGTMYGVDGSIYEQGNADFIVAMTEAVIQGFNTTGGMFEGLPASKVAIGLPACSNAAGGGFVDSATVKSAIDYLLGNGPQPGTYVLSNSNGYPTLKGMMTWSINWDALSNCETAYQFANNYQDIFFGVASTVSESDSFKPLSVHPNPSEGLFTITSLPEHAIIIVTNLQGQEILKVQATQKEMNFQLQKSGIYIVYVTSKQGTTARKLVVNN
jgi:chitinase